MNFSEISDILIYDKNIVSIFNEDICLWKRKKLDIYIVNLLKPANSSNWTVSGLSNPINNPYGRSLPNEENKYTGLETTALSSNVEGLYISKDTIHLIKRHTYYLRWTQISATANYASVTYDCYWPIAEPSVVRKTSTLYIADTTGNAISYSSTPNVLPCMSNNAYQMNTLIVTMPDAIGDYQIRFDVNNNYKGFQTNFCCPMLIDLTETYTNNGLEIPTFSNLNKKGYFEGSINLNEWK